MSNPYFALLRKSWRYAREEKRKFLLIYLMFVVANLIVASNPLFYGWFVDRLQQDGLNVMQTTWIYVLGFLGLRLAEWLFHGPGRVMERDLAFRIGRNFQDNLLDKTLQMPTSWHQENHSGSTISRMRKAHEALRDFFQNGFIYLYSIGKFLFSFAAMLYFSPLFGSIGIVLGFITVLIIIRFDKPYIRSLKEVASKEHEVSSNLFDALSNITTVIILRLQRRIHSSFLEKAAEVFPPFKRNVRINEWKWFTAQMMVGLIYAVTVFGYIWQHWTPGSIFQIGGLIVLIGYVNQFTSVFNDIASQYTQIMRFHTELKNVEEIENFVQPVTTKATLPNNWSHIEMSDVSYTRPGSKRGPGLHGLSMRIRKGQRIAVIGESGSGKSTLLTLMRGLNTPDHASLFVDNKIRIPFEALHDAVTLFPQEPEIFENTILYNITLGMDIPKAEVLKACDEAFFTEVLMKMPDGLMTVIKEKGVNLSGGQKQRLALARGILAARFSEIILMDEPTSSVDPRTERMIYRNMFDRFSDKAVVSTLHRLHLLTQFDYVYILRDGRVIDEGSFEELKKYSLVFKEMWEHQATTEVAEAVLEEFPRLNVAL